MHNGLPLGVPELRLAEVGLVVPRPDQPGSCEPLRAHVRDLDHGHRGPKSQEGGREPKQDFESILFEQRT